MWLDIVSPNLKDNKSKETKNLYICNLHFPETAFNNNKIKVNVNGMEVLKPRQFYTLKESSVPCIFDVSKMTKFEKINAR